MVTVRQLSVFLENKSGRLIEVLETLGKEHIRITALTIADTSEYGILRLIVSDPENGYRVLKAAGASVIMSTVLALEA
ncbi:MAG: acetolactate synthase, partial [Bacteroidales bacterium]|nr:acetolactate synthase [Bacteroidales bacterium]